MMKTGLMILGRGQMRQLGTGALRFQKKGCGCEKSKLNPTHTRRSLVLRVFEMGECLGVHRGSEKINRLIMGLQGRS